MSQKIITKCEKERFNYWLLGDIKARSSPETPNSLSPGTYSVEEYCIGFFSPIITLKIWIFYFFHHSDLAKASIIAPQRYILVNLSHWWFEITPSHLDILFNYFGKRSLSWNFHLILFEHKSIVLPLHIIKVYLYWILFIRSAWLNLTHGSRLHFFIATLFSNA